MQGNSAPEYTLKYSLFIEYEDVYMILAYYNEYCVLRQQFDYHILATLRYKNHAESKEFAGSTEALLPSHSQPELTAFVLSNFVGKCET